MKINKKLKYTFISSLTLISSAVSVVACGSKNKTDDKNYTDFLTFLNNNLKGSENQKNFFQKYSSFSLLKDFKFPGGIEQKDITVSIPKDIDPENTYIFDNVDQIKLSDLEYGGININKKNKKSISFTNNNATIKLDYACFVSKFDIYVKYKDSFTKTKVLNYNLTSFFQLENTKEGINLNFLPFNTKMQLNGTPLVDNFLANNVNFKFNGNEQEDPLLGLNKNSKVLVANKMFAEDKGCEWDDTFTANKDSYAYYNVDFDKADSLKFDNKANAISFTYDSVLDDGYLYGSSNLYKYFSKFYFIEDLNKLNPDNSFTVSVDKTNPLAVIFAQQKINIF